MKIRFLNVRLENDRRTDVLKLTRAFDRQHVEADESFFTLLRGETCEFSFYVAIVKTAKTRFNFHIISTGETPDVFGHEIDEHLSTNFKERRDDLQRKT